MKEEFQQVAKGITEAIQKMTELHIPPTKPSSHSKRWWTKELLQMKVETAKLAHLSKQMRFLPDHPSHKEHHILCNWYSEAIKCTKQEHWLNWLENINCDKIWIANKYLNSEPSDGGPSHVPSLKVKQPNRSVTTATSNDKKSMALTTSFFPPPPPQSSVPLNSTYPDPIPDPGDITEDHITWCISKLSAMKALGPDGIKNIIFKQCSNTLIPQMLCIFCAVLLLNTYYDPWREFIIVILCKPGKSNYTISKAYCPIALLNTTGKLLTTVIADQLSYLIETHNLLPNTHFGEADQGGQPPTPSTYWK